MQNCISQTVILPSVKIGITQYPFPVWFCLFMGTALQLIIKLSTKHKFTTLLMLGVLFSLANWCTQGDITLQKLTYKQEKATCPF